MLPGLEQLQTYSLRTIPNEHAMDRLLRTTFPAECGVKITAEPTAYFSMFLRRNWTRSATSFRPSSSTPRAEGPSRLLCPKFPDLERIRANLYDYS
jgi:hypothetical protein